MKTEELDKLIKKNHNRNLIKTLKKLGKLPKDFDKTPLLKLLNHKNPKIRSLAIKNLAKTQDINLLDNYILILKKDDSGEVRKETVSAIGRLRNKKTIEFLFSLLKDPNPEVVLQTIRALLIFKKEEKIIDKLKKLTNHPNEIVREVIKKEFFKESYKNNLLRHSKSLKSLKNCIVKGDVLRILEEVPENSIHLTFTSPPYYNARDYSIYKSYKEYLVFLEKVFNEIHRITKEGRFFILNTSPIIIQRVSRQHSSKRYPIPYDLHCILVNSGWEFIDDIIWIKPEASVKNRNAGFLQHRKPLAYKPNACSENVMVYRKKTDKLIDWNIKQYDKEIIEQSKVKDKYETGNIWKIDPVFDKTHTAVFPKELCDRIIKFYSFVGDLVFDPFAGSGTVGKASLNLNRYFFLTEIKEEYVNRIKNLLSNQILLKNYKKPTFLNIKEFKDSIKNELNFIRSSSKKNNKKIK